MLSSNVDPITEYIWDSRKITAVIIRFYIQLHNIAVSLSVGIFLTVWQIESESNPITFSLFYIIMKAEIKGWKRNDYLMKRWAGNMLLKLKRSPIVIFITHILSTQIAVHCVKREKPQKSLMIIFIAYKPTPHRMLSVQYVKRNADVWCCPTMLTLLLNIWECWFFCWISGTAVKSQQSS